MILIYVPNLFLHTQKNFLYQIMHDHDLIFLSFNVYYYNCFFYLLSNKMQQDAIHHRFDDLNSPLHMYSKTTPLNG